MKSQNYNQIRKMYSEPEISHIKIDNDISLQLESEPPLGPDESRNTIPENFSNNPFVPQLT